MKRLLLAHLLDRWADQLEMTTQELDKTLPIPRKTIKTQTYIGQPLTNVFRNITPSTHPELYKETDEPLGLGELDPYRDLANELRDLAGQLRTEKDPDMDRDWSQPVISRLTEQEYIRGLTEQEYLREVQGTFSGGADQ